MNDMSDHDVLSESVLRRSDRKSEASDDRRGGLARLPRPDLRPRPLLLGLFGRESARTLRRAALVHAAARRMNHPVALDAHLPPLDVDHAEEAALTVQNGCVSGSKRVAQLTRSKDCCDRKRKSHWPLAKAERRLGSRKDDVVLRAAYLLGPDGLDDFDQAVTDIADRRRDRIEISIVGPLAPWDFVELDLGPRQARLLGLGFPGGPFIDRAAQDGDPGSVRFPRGLTGPGDAPSDFSFSGLKTALFYAVRKLTGDELAERRADLAASYQRAIVRALVERAEAAAEQRNAGLIAVAGGVAANSELRSALPGAALAPLALCTDNAAMIASAARYADAVPSPGYLAVDAYAST